MKVFLAGATGAIGTRLVSLLVRAGHTVTGTTRHRDKAESIRAAGAIPAVVDALNPRDVLAAVQQAEPNVIIHQLTAIPARFNMRRFDHAFAATNRLRNEGTDHLLAAARTVGCRFSNGWGSGSPQSGTAGVGNGARSRCYPGVMSN
jgi:nucleoside-diphosphate-sugar epimerase